MIIEVNGKLEDRDFESILQLTKPWMYLTMMRYSCNRDDYEDIMQEMSIDLWNFLNRGYDSTKASFKTVVIKCFRNRCLLFIRKQNKKVANETDFDEVLENVLPDEETTTVDTSPELFNFLRSLVPDKRVDIFIDILKGKRQVDIAKEKGVTRQYICACRKAMEEEFKCHRREIREYLGKDKKRVACNREESIYWLE